MMIENNKKKTYAEAVVGLAKEEKSGKEDVTWKEVESKQVKKAARKLNKAQRVEASVAALAAAAPIKKANDRQRKAWTVALGEEKCSAEVCSNNAVGNRCKCGGCKDR
jgi:hypothetical protein